MRTFSIPAMLVGACALGYFDIGAALELRYGAEYRGEYSSNAGRSSSGRKADWINVGELRFDLADSPAGFVAAGRGLLSASSRGVNLTGTSAYIEAERRRASSAEKRSLRLERPPKDIIAVLSGRAVYENYVNGTFGDQFLFGFDAFADFMIRPRWFSWTLEDRYAQAPVSRSEASTVLAADNRQDFNALSTGPNFSFRLAPEHIVEVEGRYGNDSFQKSPTDSQRYSGAVRWVYEWSPSTLLSVNGSVRRVDFDEASLRGDYDRQDVFVGIGAQRARSDLLMNVGWTFINRESGNSVSKPLGRLAWSYRLTSKSTVGASATAEHTDTAEILSGIAAGTIGRDTVGFTGGAVVPDIIFEKRAEIYYEQAGSFLSGRISIVGSDRDYSTSPLDEVAYGGLVDLAYHLSATLSARCDAAYTRRESQNVKRVDDDRELGLSLLYRAQRHVSLGLRIGWAERSSTDPRSGFQEFLGGFTIAYAR